MSDSPDNLRKPDAGVTTEADAPPVLNFVGRPERSGFRESIGQWAQNTFSRDQLSNAAKSLAWVAPLTILIWIYAEREQVKPLPGVTVPIEVRSNDPNRIVTLVRPPDGNILVTLTGPVARMDLVRDRLNPQMGSAPVLINVDARMGVGAQRIRAINLGDDPRFVANGVSVSNPQPEWLEVYIDPIETRTAPVKPPPDKTYLTPPVFEPKTVLIRGPKKVLDDAQRDGKLVAHAELDGRPELVNATGQVELRNVKVRVPIENVHVAVVQPETVSATIQPDVPEELPLDIVRVFVESPPAAGGALLSDYVIEYPPLLNGVRVQGPAEAIRALANSEELRKQVKARFEISPNDVGEGKRAKLKYDFPDKRITPAKDAPQEITFSLRRKTVE